MYTWVNHEDKDWLVQYQSALAANSDEGARHRTAKTIARFQCRNELVYSIRSVKKYAPWVRRIFVLTNCTLPAEVAADPRVTPVSHEAVFPDPAVLPVFNSRAIESNLHRIEELAEHFLYFNDDFFLCRPVEKGDFFDAQGNVYVFPSKHDMPDPEKADLSPFEHGALNTCRLVYQETGYMPAKRLHHAPYPVRRSTLVEIERKYPELLAQTREHKFRHNADIPLATSMHAYYSVAHGRGELRDFACRYVDIGDPAFLLLVLPLSPLRRGKYVSLCLNEREDMQYFPRLRDWYVQRLLEKMFGGPSTGAVRE
ncbi:stealth conserved region 3 domain-containing protein [Mangrovimicrobium sediminis]|uniref:stealth conserved region 3 domain-containing protein n=1 Tax=Mangrovimicrobium sediminis TaxID=2562682 RepID=UPI001436B8FA|nr:stealth conserved region 3 domain-containing protein [Haliea sp. SAOS-164]